MTSGNSVGSLSEKQQSLIIGCLLGDGYMRCKTNAHLQITHSIHQKEYVDWKYRILSNIVRTPPKAYRGNGGRVGYRFFTRSLPSLTRYYHLFYDNGRKRIPRDLILNEFSLACWYMDDGSKSHRSCYLNTQQLTLTDQQYLCILMRKRFGLRPAIDKDKQYFRLRFSVCESAQLVTKIQPHVIASLRYKLPI